jgi:hypothetical protein
MIPQHQLLRIRVQVHLLPNPLRYRLPSQVVLQQGHRHDERHHPLAVVLDEARSSNLPQVGLVVTRQIPFEVAHETLEHVHVLAAGAEQGKSLHEQPSVGS